MALKVDPMKCTGCRICEFACNYHHDGSISPIGSSLMYYYEEKKNYYGMMVKRDKTLMLGRPEGEKVLMPGEQIEGAGQAQSRFFCASPAIFAKKRITGRCACRHALTAF